MTRGSVRFAPAPVPVDVGIVAALPIEVAPIRARLRETRDYGLGRERVREGVLAGKLIALSIAGPGRVAAARAAARLIAGHRPQWILSVGFAGALDPAIERQTVFLPSISIDPEGRRLQIDLSYRDGGNSRVGSLVTVDQIVRSAAEKQRLRQQSGADAVDMETSAIVDLCERKRTRFLGVRIITDQADEDLPPEVLTILGPTGSFRLGAAAGALWRRPSCVKDLWTLREHATEAARRLAAILPGLIAQLP